MALGIRVSLIGAKLTPAPDVSKIRVRHAFVAYVIAFVISGVLERVAWIFPGLAQPILAFVTLKWAVLFLFFYLALEKREAYLQLALVFVFEAVVGMVGFFANFKTVFFVLVIALLSSRENFAVVAWPLLVHL